jgi:hypothetical protein
MAGPQDYLTVQGPQGASYSLPKFDLGSQIASIPTSYQEGQQYGVKRALQTAFQDGLPRVNNDPNGPIDYNAMAERLVKIGGPEAAQQYFGLMQQQQYQKSLDQELGGGGQPQQGNPPQTFRPMAPNAATGSAGITGEHLSTGGGSIFPYKPGTSPPQIMSGGPQGGAGLGGQPAPFAGNRDQQGAPPGPVGGGTITEDGTTGQPNAPTSARETANNGRLPSASALTGGRDPIKVLNEYDQKLKRLGLLGGYPGITPAQSANLIQQGKQLEAQRKTLADAIAADTGVTPKVKETQQAGYGNDVPGYEGAQAGAKKIGEAQGSVIASYIDRGQSAYKRLQMLDTVGDALQRGGGNITTGPFAEAALRTKQALSSMFGLDLEGVPEAEVAQKTGFGLATQAVKEITSRPTQMEVKMALQNNPGLLLSPKGSAMMIDVMKQAARQDVDLARLASKKENQANWPDVVDKYYADHPLLSPFDHKTPLGMKDVKAIGGTAAQAIPDGATATHPGTGARMIMQGGKWIPLKAGPST